MSESEKKKRLNIGLLANDLGDEYCKLVCMGASRAAEEKDCNLFVYSGRFFDAPLLNKRIDSYAYQYNTVFTYATSAQLDALIVNIGTIDVGDSPEEIQDFLDGIDNIPVVFIGRRRHGCGSVIFDQRSSMSRVVEHLIEVHGCRRIAFVAGPVGNPDSVERLRAYIDALEKHGIKYNQNLVAHGDFTSHYTTPIAELLDREKNLDAICFANDLMARAGYKLMRERGIEPGVDIAVTGFDNSVLSSTMCPELTTVSADPDCLGYNAVCSALEQLSGEPPHDMLIEARFLQRYSCGCTTQVIDTYKTPDSRVDCTPSELVDIVYDQIQTHSSLNSLYTALRPFFVRIANFALCSGVSSLPVGLRDEFVSIVQHKLPDSISARSVNYLLRSMRDLLLSQVTEPKLRESIQELFYDLTNCITDTLMTNNYLLAHEARGGIYLLDNLPLYDNCDLDGQLEMIMHHLTQLDLYSSYIYLASSPFEVNSIGGYRPFETLYLKAYSHGKDCFTIPGFGEEIQNSEIFENKYIGEHRRTIVLSSIFYRNEHYGLFACELPASQMYCVQMLTMQICLITQNITTINQLSEENALLSSIASEDKLTGLLNKRGFHEAADKALASPDNRGRTALIAFVDMNNLKITNDSYGHNEGNYALKLIASVLRKSFGEDSIIARVGGDEFNVFTILSGDKTPGEYRRLLKSAIKLASDETDKPYEVTFSTGLSTVVCEPGIRLDSFLAIADSDMYADKHNKPTGIEKRRRRATDSVPPNK